MDLQGGLNMYMFCVKDGEIKQERYLSELSPYGRKVKYLNKGGSKYDREHANVFFQEGQVLTVNEIYVGSWSSDVEFVEHPLLKFNTVMFEDIK